MKLLSGLARPAQKYAAAIFAAGVLAACFSSPALAQSGPGPRPGTQAALQCLLRQGPSGCEQMFVARATLAARPWVWQNPDRDFKRGPLIFSKYFGRASPDNVFDEKVLHRQMADQMDIFDVKYTHFEWTFYIAPADADGKIRYLEIELYPPHDLNQLHR